MSEFSFIGGELCLDFANTCSWGPEPEQDETLKSYQDLVRWAEAAGLVDRPAEWLRQASEEPPGAERALRKAVRLRRTLHDVFSARVRGDVTPTESLERLNRALSRALPQLVVACGEDQHCFRFEEDPRHLSSLLNPVLWSAAGLLTSPQSSQIKECASSSCRWLFVDRSRRANRRWCEMSNCGSRDKARRYYRRRAGVESN